MSGLAGRAAIVTGAGRGIGRAIAHGLAGNGVRVSLLARTESEIAGVRDELMSMGGPRASAAAAIRCDVTDPASIRAAVAEAEKALGPTEILVNGAGEAISAPLLKTDDQLWSHMMSVNLSGTFFMIREVAASMISRQGGRIINVASVAGLTGAAYVSAYTAAKHGVVGLTRALSQELARSGITINAVCPGYVDTAMTDRSVANIAEKTGMSEEKTRSHIASRSPQNRLMTAEEVAGLVVYLASDEARGINGQAIVLDGGGLAAS